VLFSGGKILEFKYVEKLLEPQAYMITRFMESLSNNDPDAFWSCLSRSDMSYLHGMLMGVNTEEETFRFDEFLQETLDNTRKYYKEYINNYGVSTSVRYSSNIVANVFLPKNIETNITFIQPIDALVMVVPLILELYTNDNDEMVGEWKVYFFSNKSLETPFN
jgi:hypothetical protein